VQVKDNVLHYTRTYEIKDIIVPTATAEKSSALLRQATP
jgi:hypothetical protein